MKKSKKIVFLSATLGSVLGIVFIAIALLSVNFDVRNLDLCGEPQKITKECGTMEDLKDICIDLRNNINITLLGSDKSSNIRVKESPDNKIHITYYTTDCCSKKLETANQQIFLHEPDALIHINAKQFTKGIFHGAKQWGLETVIEIPSSQMNIEDMETLADYLQTLADKAPAIQLKTTNGNIIIEKAAVSSLTAQTSNGYISASNIYTNVFNVFGLNGDILLNNAYTLNSSAKTTNGSVTAQNIECYGRTDFHTINGIVSLDKVSAFEISTGTTNGQISLSEVQSRGDLWALTTNGDIMLKNIKASIITFQTTNGTIWGNIIGNPDDYSIISSTTNGNNSLAVYNEYTGGNIFHDISICTTNGNISVEFTEDKDNDR